MDSSVHCLNDIKATLILQVEICESPNGVLQLGSGWKENVLMRAYFFPPRAIDNPVLILFALRMQWLIREYSLKLLNSYEMKEDLYESLLAFI